MLNIRLLFRIMAMIMSQSIPQTRYQNKPLVEKISEKFDA